MSDSTLSKVVDEIAQSENDGTFQGRTLAASKKAIRRLMDRARLSDPELIATLRAHLNADKTQLFVIRGEIHEHAVPDYAIRQRALETALRIKGLLIPENATGHQSFTVVVQNDITIPPGKRLDGRARLVEVIAKRLGGEVIESRAPSEADDPPVEPSNDGNCSDDPECQ